MKLNKFNIIILILITIVTLSITTNAVVPDDCPSGLISYWKLDEQSIGPVIDDYNSYDGINNGATINQPGKVNQAYTFDGVDDYIDCGDITELNSVSAFTIMGWFKDNDIGGHNRHFDKGDGDKNDISGATYNNKLYIEVGNGANTYAYWSGYSSEINAGEWYFAAFIFDGSGTTNADKAKIFVNGIQKSLTFSWGNMPSTTADLSGYPFTISKSSVNGNPWNGDIDEIAIYDRALSPSEIMAHYNLGLTGHGYCYNHDSNVNCLLAPNHLGDNIIETIGSSSEPTLQSILDNEFGSGIIDVVTDQTQYQIWEFAENINCLDLEVEYIAGFAGATNTFGYYYGNTPGQCSNFILNPLFTDPPTSPGYIYSISIPSGSYSYIGFYLDSTHQGGVSLFTEHGCNPSFIPPNPSGQRDYTLVYEVPQGSMEPGSIAEYVIAFEDPIDFDYNDVVVILRVLEDSTPPLITIDVPSDDECLCCPFDIQATVTDPDCPSSGVYSVDAIITENGDFISDIHLMNSGGDIWEETLDCTQLPTGSYELKIDTMDNCGNQAISDTIEIHIDTTAPTTSKDYGIPFYTDGNQDWISTWTPITLTATDTGCSGVDTIYYRIYQQTSGWTPWIEYDQPFTITEGCTHTIEFYAIDHCGNIESVQSQDVNVDDTPPEIIMEYPSHGYYNDPSSGISYMKCEAPLELIATDLPDCPSGVKGVYWGYTYDGTWYPDNPTGIFEYGKYWYTYDEINAIRFTEDCIHTLEYWTDDYIGNMGQIYTQTYYVDCTPPMVTKTHPPDYIEIESSPVQTGYIPLGSNIILEAEDVGLDPCISGIENLFWRYEYDGVSYPLPSEPGVIDGSTLGSLYGYSDPEIVDYWWYIELTDATITFDQLGKNDLYYWAKDNVCNNGMIHHQCYWVVDCADDIWVDDDADPGWYSWTNVSTIQTGVDRVGDGGTVHVLDGVYTEDIVVGDSPYCPGRQDITIIAESEPVGMALVDGDVAVINGTLQIDTIGTRVENFSIQLPEVGTPAVTVNVEGVVLIHNYFHDWCMIPAYGQIALSSSVPVDTRHNWWGAPDGPGGYAVDPGTNRVADGFGGDIVGDQVLFDPWAGVDACFEVSQTSAQTGTGIYFDAGLSFAQHLIPVYENDVNMLWDFDDGMYSNEESTMYHFDAAGTYQVTLRVDATDSDLWPGRLFDWATVTITVSDPGSPLMANADTNNFGGYETVRFDPIQLYGSATGGSPPYSYEWTFGDGGVSSEQNPVHSYEEEGTYVVTLKVTDSKDDTAVDTAEVVVHGLEDLVVYPGGPYHGIPGFAVFFSGSATGGLAPFTYTWDFGDGTPLIEAVNPVHSYELEGTYTVTLMVVDSEGTMVSRSTQVVVKGEEPELVSILGVSGGLGVKVLIKAGDYPVEWMLSVDGNLVFGETESSGSILAETSDTVYLRYPFGFGPVQIRFTANEVSKEYTSFMIGPIFLNLQEV